MSQHFEFKILETSTPTACEDQLNELGDLGWQLVTILKWESKWYYYFQRERTSH